MCSLRWCGVMHGVWWCVVQCSVVWCGVVLCGVEFYSCCICVE